MFSKSSSRSTPELPSRSQPANPISNLTVIAQGVEITGNIITTGEVQLDGVIKGDLRCGGLTIGEGGVLVGTIAAEKLAVRGTIQGTVAAKTVALERTAQVTGDITHETLSVDTGAQLDGRLIRKSDPHVSELPIGGSADMQPALKAV